MKVLRICIYQPHAHFRMPVTYKRRHTYPIPPYSTVLGFLINVLGITDQRTAEFEEFKELKLSISGRFGSKTTEYVWFRNLSRDAHKKVFGTTTNREINGRVQHPGGQSPIHVDVLDENYIYIHLYHEDQQFIKMVQSALENPTKRTGVVHLGRAEDWIVFQSPKKSGNGIEWIDLEPRVTDTNFDHYFWIPEKSHFSNYEKDYSEADGLRYRLPTISTIEDYEKTYNHNGRRSFEYLTVRLNDGLIMGMDYMYDGDLHLPVFLTSSLYQKSYG